MRVNEQGRSMIEMLGVLAIVGVLSVGGIAGYSKAMNKFKTNKVIDQINMISTNVRTLFSSQRNYHGLTNKIAITTGIVPGEMIADPTGSNSTITNAFGGQVKIGPSASVGDGEGAYTIATNGIPASSCISILTTDWGGDSGSGVVAIYALADDAEDSYSAAFDKLADAGQSLTAAYDLAVPGDDTYGLPFSISNANSACYGGQRTGTKVDVAIAWKFM